MRKSWLVATSTYRRRVRSGTFLMLTFGLPLLMVIVSGVGILSELGGGLPHVGYVDQTGQLAPISSVAVNDQTLRLTSYAAIDAAEQALEAEFELLPPGTELPEISPQMRRVLVIDVSEHGRELGLTDEELAAAIQPHLDAKGGEWGPGLPDDAPPMPRGDGLGDIPLKLGDEWLSLREVAQITETMEPDCIVRRLSAGKD